MNFSRTLFSPLLKFYLDQIDALVTEVRNKEKENNKKEIANVLDELKRDSSKLSQKDEKVNSEDEAPEITVS